ncbi:streptomycin 3''-adenylyltransferase domain protein [Staphylococcus aureus subsp. aureus CIG1500]|nr:streptomycin 3''-adenylyltransferase domain protein [Staphylococcus aureus subsp. aureus CIG1500]
MSNLINGKIPNQAIQTFKKSLKDLFWKFNSWSISIWFSSKWWFYALTAM